MARILAIIPAYNEEAHIAKVIIAVAQHVKDIVVVDDGSADNTAKLAELAGAKTLKLSVNLGYGAALETGYRYAIQNHFDAVVQLDADGQHDPSSINDLLEMVLNNKADVAVGSRFLDKSNSYKPGVARIAGIKYLSWLIKLLTGENLTDPTSGYQALSSKALHFILSADFPDDYPDADVLVCIKRAGLRIVEVPVLMKEREGGKSMHSGMMPLYYMFKMTLSMLLVLLRKTPKINILM